MTQRQSFDSFSNSNHGIPSNMFSWSTLQLWIGIIISQISHNLGRNHVIENRKVWYSNPSSLGGKFGKCN